MISTSSIPWCACFDAAEDERRDLVEVGALAQLHGDARELVVRVHAVHVRLEGDHDSVRVQPELLVEDLERRLQSHDPELDPVHEDVAPDRVGTAEELYAERRADDRDRAAALAVVVREAAAGRDRAVHEERVVGREARDPDALGTSRRADARGLRRARQERDDAGMGGRDAHEILVPQAGAHREALLLLGRLRRLRLDDDRAVPAHPREADRDLVHDAVEDGGHDDEREDAQHEEREREDRAQLVRPKLDEPADDDLPEDAEARAARTGASSRRATASGSGSATLLIPQRLHRGEAARLPGGVEREEEAEARPRARRPRGSSRAPCRAGPGGRT